MCLNSLGPEDININTNHNDNDREFITSLWGDNCRSIL
jgi:hypothetical protein